MSPSLMTNVSAGVHFGAARAILCTRPVPGSTPVFRPQTPAAKAGTRLLALAMIPYNGSARRSVQATLSGAVHAPFSQSRHRPRGLRARARALPPAPRGGAPPRGERAVARGGSGADGGLRSVAAARLHEGAVLREGELLRQVAL